MSHLTQEAPDHGETQDESTGESRALRVGWFFSDVVWVEPSREEDAPDARDGSR
jgi:hypothetical protein